MQIVKCDRNSQLRKDGDYEGTHLRKNESTRKYGTKARNGSQVHACPLRWKIFVGIPWRGNTIRFGVPAGLIQNSVKKREREKRRSQTKIFFFSRIRNLKIII